MKNTKQTYGILGILGVFLLLLGVVGANAQTYYTDGAGNRIPFTDNPSVYTWMYNGDGTYKLANGGTFTLNNVDDSAIIATGSDDSSAITTTPAASWSTSITGADESQNTNMNSDDQAYIVGSTLYMDGQPVTDNGYTLVNEEE